MELNGWKLGFLICYDIEFPENARRLALAGAELILVPTANMIPYDFVADVTIRARAFENQCYVAYANYCGQEDQIRYCGQSSIAAPDGSRIALAGLDEALIIGTLDRALMNESRALNRYLADRRPELYGAGQALIPGYPLAWAPLCPGCAHARAEPPLPHLETLANGLQVSVRHAPHLKRCAATLRVAAGSHDVPPAWPGLAHFLEHLLFLGTERFPADQGLMAYVRAQGGQLNAKTCERSTEFFFELPANAFAAGLERLCDMLARPRLDLAEQRRERECCMRNSSLGPAMPRPNASSPCSTACPRPIRCGPSMLAIATA